MFSIYTAPEKCENMQWPAILFWICIVFEKLRFHFFFCSHETQSRRLQISLFEERFRKALVSLQISVDGNPNGSFHKFFRPSVNGDWDL